MGSLLSRAFNLLPGAKDVNPTGLICLLRIGDRLRSSRYQRAHEFVTDHDPAR
jgi:hypothetical protein